MTDLIFFDTDCISAFLWVNNECLLSKLYFGNIVIPMQVYNELSNPRVAWMKNRIDTLLNKGVASLEDINVDSKEYDLYYKLTRAPEKKHKIIGKGEAACISLAKNHSGIIASNNLRDIKDYVEEFGLNYITTGDILVEAYKKGLIDENQANIIWKDMLNKRRKLGASSFTDYLRSFIKEYED